MEKTNWSPSRFGCYKQCPVKYKFSYMDGLSTWGRSFDLAVKGTCFHDIAEHTEIGESYESVYNRAVETIDKYEFDKEKYPVVNSIPIFYKWWTTFVEPLVKAGFEIHKEEWKKGTFGGEPIVGAVDLYLINKETKECYIFDYKSSSSPHMDNYKYQLLIYTWYIANELGLEPEEIPSHIHSALFFPLADIKKFTATDEAAIEKRMLKDILELKFTVDDYKKDIAELESIVKASRARDWSQIDLKGEAVISFACNFCDIAGHYKYCPLTAESGVQWPAGVFVCSNEDRKIVDAIDAVNKWVVTDEHTEEEVVEYLKKKKVYDSSPTEDIERLKQTMACATIRKGSRTIV